MKHASKDQMLIIGFISMAVGVSLGAFGAHALQEILSERYFEVYKTATLYLFIHALGLICLSLLSYTKPNIQLKWAKICCLTGMILFCGSLYILSFNELWHTPSLRKLGAIAPIGGISFVLCWILAALAVYREAIYE